MILDTLSFHPAKTINIIFFFQKDKARLARARMRKWETITTIFFTSLVAISMQGAQAAKSFHTGNYRHRGETVTHAAPRKLGVGHSEGAPESQEKGKAKKDKDTPAPVPYYKPETSQPSAERVEPVSSPSVAPVNRATTAPSSEDKNGSPEGPIPSPSLALTLKPSLLSSPTFPINVPSAEPTSKSSSELTIGEAQGSSGETPETNDGSTSPSIFPSPEPTFELIASVPPTTNGQTPESNDGSNITLSPAPTNVPSPGPTSQSPFELIPNDPQEGSEQTPEDNDVSNESPTDEPKVEISSTAGEFYQHKSCNDEMKNVGRLTLSLSSLMRRPRRRYSKGGSLVGVFRGVAQRGSESGGCECCYCPG